MGSNLAKPGSREPAKPQDRDVRRRRLRGDVVRLREQLSFGSSTCRSMRTTGRMMIVADSLRSVLTRPSL
jgi:hypothetical protein